MDTLELFLKKGRDYAKAGDYAAAERFYASAAYMIKDLGDTELRTVYEREVSPVLDILRGSREHEEGLGGFDIGEARREFLGTIGCGQEHTAARYSLYAAERAVRREQRDLGIQERLYELYSKLGV